MKGLSHLLQLLLKICLIFHLIFPSSRSATASPSAITSESLEFLTLGIMARYFEDNCILAILSPSETNFQFDSEHYSIVTVEEFDGHDEDRYVQEVLAPSMEIGCHGHVIQTENPRRQLSLIERTYIKVAQRVERKFLILPLVSDRRDNKTGHRFVRGDTEYLHDVFNSRSIRYVPNIVVVIPTDENELALYTHHFGGPGDSFKQLVLLDVFLPKPNTFLNGDDLFPDKVADLKGRVLTAASLEYLPYVAIDPETGNLFGTEWNAVKEFCERRNCVLEPLMDNVNLFGEIFDNGTGNGVLGNIAEDRADVGFGSVNPRYHEWLFLDLGPPFIRTAITCLVPKPRPLALWSTPLMPFSRVLWCVVVASVLVDALTLYIVYAVPDFVRQNTPTTKDHQRFMTPFNACLIAVSLCVEQGLSTEVTGSSRRITVITLLLASLVISTTYGSGLSSVLTVPRYEKPIDTAEELEASGLQWSAPHEAWAFPLYGANDSWILSLVDHFVVLPPDVTTKKAYEAAMGFCVERLSGGNYAIQNYLPSTAVENLHVMAGQVYWTYAISMLRKSSPFTERYTMLELELMASGIPVYWEYDSVVHSLDSVTQSVVRHTTLDNGPVQLNIAQIQGAFYFLCFGLSLSALICACEINFHRFQR